MHKMVTLLNQPLITILLTIILCTLFYNFGSNTTTTTTTVAPPCNDQQLFQTSTTSPPPLDFKAHHTSFLPINTNQQLQTAFPYCPKNFTNYCPCHDPKKERLFHVEKKFHRERHCPGKGEALNCLIPKPSGYKTPFQWPKSKDVAWFKNVPFKRLTEYKKTQNWVRLEGNRLVFPGGGTSFPLGVKGYIDILKQIVPLRSGAIRTVLDIGCGVASFGASLMEYNILTMSIAPRDIHEAQVQFALERGLPAMLGVLSIHRLPFSARSFDMAHCARCLVNWTSYDGLYLIEIDRVLRPGGYWVLSGPPISWKVSYKNWEREASDLETEQNELEDLARRLCWKKVREKGPISVWQKPQNHIHCAQKLNVWKSLKFCSDNDDPNTSWYKKMEACITPLPKVKNIRETSGGSLKDWPQRLKTAPHRVTSKEININTRTFYEDTETWRKRVKYYGSVLVTLFHGRYRNVMDMNAGFGGFAAALSDYSSVSWVMNVVPFDTKYNTLGIIYDRGLLGTYMNWCEAFSTEPRTYDLIHADGIFSMYMDKCDIHDILFEMDRILRPGGAVIVRDNVDIIVKLKDMAERMRWNSKVLHSENGSFHPMKILLIDKSY